MKNFIIATLIMGIAIACQPPVEKQYFTSSPEIDIAKTVISSYLTQDWDTYRQQFADTVEIFFNQWGDPTSIDSLVENHKSSLVNVSNVSFTGPGRDEPVYEMVTTDSGEHWVHFWGLWSGTFTPTGNTVQFPVNVSFQVENGLVVRDVAIYDSAPILLETQAAAEAAMESEMNEEESDN